MGGECPAAPVRQPLPATPHPSEGRGGQRPGRGEEGQGVGSVSSYSVAATVYVHVYVPFSLSLVTSLRVTV